MAAKVFKMVLAASLAAAAHSLATPQPPRTPPAAEAPAKSPSAPKSMNLFEVETSSASVSFGPRRTMPESTWIRKKASDGGAGASVTMGKYYRTGKGVKQNMYAARGWYKKAAKKKAKTCNPGGTFAYGMSLVRGEGGKRDIAVGATYLADAVAYGNPAALKSLGKIEFD